MVYDGTTDGGSFRFSKEYFPQSPTDDEEHKPSDDSDSEPKGQNQQRNNSEMAIQMLRQAVKNPEIGDADGMLSMAYEEICQALEQFNGTLSGIVAFFDTRVHSPVPFSSVGDIRKAGPYGGGGTDYESIFRYIRSNYSYNAPTSIVIITDGEEVYPDESAANNIPVLWLLTGNEKAP